MVINSVYVQTNFAGLRAIERPFMPEQQPLIDGRYEELKAGPFH